MIQLRFTDGSVGTAAALKRYTAHVAGGHITRICGEGCTCGGKPRYRSLTEASEELDRRLGKDYSVDALRRELAADPELAAVYNPIHPAPQVVGEDLHRRVREHMAQHNSRDYSRALRMVLDADPSLRRYAEGEDEDEERPSSGTFQIKRYGGAR